MVRDRPRQQARALAVLSTVVLLGSLVTATRTEPAEAGSQPPALGPARPLAQSADATGRVDPAGGPKNAADVYRYLENPQLVGEGQQAPHVDLRPQRDARAAVEAADAVGAAEVDAAGGKHGRRSPFVASLNGDWRLRLFDRPDDVPAGFGRDGFDASAWPTATVPHTWQSDYLDHPMFRNWSTEMWPDAPPRVPRDINPTGAYLKTFDLPRQWSGGRVFLRFEAVTSGYFVWVNGGYAGYDQGGYTPAEFDVTDLLRPGRNRIAVQVHRWGSGSHLETFDQWRYSGIFRDVWLYRTEQTRLRDAYITTDLDGRYRDATLTARVDVAAATGAPRGAFTVRGTLRDDHGRPVSTMIGGVDIPAGGGDRRVTLSAKVTDPAKWSAEDPNLYKLVLELLAPNGRVVHTAVQTVGFREVEVRDKQLLVNGKRILIKGVNRGETDPDTGRYNTHQRQREDVFLMKRLNINAVRSSHYPSDPYLYDLANRHGLWIADEVDAETHTRQNCSEMDPTKVCLAALPQWQAAFADRFQAMVARDKNHPSVIMWDTGNEAGLGEAHYAMAEWARSNEPTRMLYHQSHAGAGSPDGFADDPAGPNPRYVVDVNGYRYTTPQRLEQLLNSPDPKYQKPVVLGEYAHAMGNSLGNFDQYWDLVRRHPSMQGGFVWDWAEANLRQPLIVTPDSSPNKIQAFLVGKPGQAPGHRGQALELSGLDDYVNVFRDRRLDLTGSVTLDAWVRPGPWGGAFPIVTKGLAYALEMDGPQKLAFVVSAGGWGVLRAEVPPDWYGSWHRVTGVYDGAAMRLYIDGRQVAVQARSGPVDPGLFEVNVGRHAGSHRDLARTRLARGLIDDVRIYGEALPAATIAAGQDPASRAVLALDFDRFDRHGEFESLGISLSGTDGLVDTDRNPQPETVELAHAHAPVRFTEVDPAAGVVRVHNEQQAGTLDLRLRWSLTEGDRTLRAGTRPLRLAPGQTVTVRLGKGPKNPHDRERWLNVAVQTTHDQAWARRGWTLARDQFAAGGRTVPGVQPAPPAGPGPAITRDNAAVTVTGSGWTYRLDTTTGTLSSMSVDGRELLRAGPRLDVNRPPISNETYWWLFEEHRAVADVVGLNRLATTVTGVSTGTEADAAVIEVRSTVAAPGLADKLAFDQTMRFRVDARGTITLDHQVTGRGSGLAKLRYLPRVGVSLQVPDSMNRFAWYGKGPHENYNDRNRSARTGVWRSTVDDQYVPYSRPQAYGNHTDTRWATLSDGRHAGILVGGNLNVSVTPYDDLDRAEYDFQLPLVRNAGWVTLHAAAGETGVGDTPHSTQQRFQVPAGQPHRYQLVLRPLTEQEVRAGGVVS